MQPSNQLSPWQIWSLDVQNKLVSQQEQLDKLEAQVLALCEQIKQLDSRPAYHIDSIQYHFDQLKVEKLDGTLNIGMTTPGMGDNEFPGSIEQMAVSKTQSTTQSFPSADSGITPPSGPYNDIYREMNRYLDVEAPKMLHNYETDLCLPLDPYHRRIIINDVRKQVPTRIQYYLQQFSKDDSSGLTGQDQATVIANVLAKTTRDADSAMLAYMQQLQNGSPATGGTT